MVQKPRLVTKDWERITCGNCGSDAALYRSKGKTVYCSACASLSASFLEPLPPWACCPAFGKLWIQDRLYVQYEPKPQFYLRHRMGEDSIVACPFCGVNPSTLIKPEDPSTLIKPEENKP